MPTEGGGTLRSALELAKRKGFSDPPELKIGEMPIWLEPVLPIFRHLSARRRFEQGTPLPLRDGDILGWCQLHRQALSPRDIELIQLLDTAWIQASQTKGEPAQPA